MKRHSSNANNLSSDTVHLPPLHHLLCSYVLSKSSLKIFPIVYKTLIITTSPHYLRSKCLGPPPFEPHLVYHQHITSWQHFYIYGHLHSSVTPHSFPNSETYKLSHSCTNTHNPSLWHTLLKRQHTLVWFDWTCNIWNNTNLNTWF